MTFVARSFEEALEIAGVSIGSEEVFVAGGAQVYETALRYADRIYKTEVHEAPDGDTFFPPHPEITREVSRSSYADVDPAYRPKLDFVIYER